MIGKTFSHYQITSQIGKGGMGEVYLAEDLSLNRKVALKFLPDEFSYDPERMARFEREAKVLASLNHANIASIYGIEQSEGKRFLVMELVEGENLAQRLSKGPLSVEEALGVCRRIADALEAAHEKGVIHRDLKPANVMITDGDKVKILDFGLAKALSDKTQSIDSSQSPTITGAMTRPGVILGTTAYMSPEQAKGKAVDKRADIWAFGCILHECLTGKKAFGGETVTETLAAVLTKEPEWEKVPEKVRPLLRRCLEKDPKKRLRDIGDAMPLLEGLPESVPTNRPWLSWIITAIAVLIAIVLSLILFREKPSAPADPVQFQFTPPVSLAPHGSFALSPDGRHLAFAGIRPDGATCLYIRDLSSLEARLLPGTESNILPPFFWSQDSRFIVFDSGGKLKKVAIAGGPPLPICDLSTIPFGGSWNGDVILFGNILDGVMRVSSTGGTASLVTRPNPDRQEQGHASPAFLPDGRHFLYLSRLGEENNKNNGIYIGSLDSKPEEQSTDLLLQTDYQFAYIPSHDSDPGYLIFLRSRILMAQQFDDKRLKLVGEAVSLGMQVGVFSSYYSLFSASTTGILAYTESINQLSRSGLTGKASLLIRR